MVQAAGSWSMDACCAVPGNDCRPPICIDRASSSDFLFGLWPGPPQRFDPTGEKDEYQYIVADTDRLGAKTWPRWGGDLAIGTSGGAPGGGRGHCEQGHTYRGTDGEICGGTDNWGATDVEVWYPR